MSIGERERQGQTRIADLERQLAEAQGKLREACKELHNWKANNSPRTSLWFYLSRILCPKEGNGG